MKISRLLVLPIIAVLAGCTAPLKPTDEVDKYLIVPGTSFVPTLLCGVDAIGEVCIRMQDGNEVKSLLNGDFNSWVQGLDKGQTLVTESGKNAIAIDKATGNALLKSLVADNKERELIEMQQYEQREDK